MTAAESTSQIDWRLELIQVPVSDVDRAKAFYVEQAGFIADHDHQLRRASVRPAHPARLGAAPSRSANGALPAAPGSHRACSWSSTTSSAREQLLGRGVEVSDVEDLPWGRFVFFTDPDGNGWAVQGIG